MAHLEAAEINASYCGRASILQGARLFGRAAASIRPIVGASSGRVGGPRRRTWGNMDRLALMMPSETPRRVRSGPSA